MKDHLMHHGTKGMHWGIRNGPPYLIEDNKKSIANRMALEIYSKAKGKEATISKDVLGAAKAANSKMYGLEHKLKTKESISRKITTDSEEKGISLDKAGKDIKDAVRYTTITDDKSFVDSYFKVKENLESKGYQEVRCKNYFDLYDKGLVKHKSVQSVFSDKDGYLFEIQFQTPSSQKAKDLKVPLYEERRKPGNSESRNRELERQMVQLAENVTTPPGIDRIRTK